MKTDQELESDYRKELQIEAEMLELGIICQQCGDYIGDDSDQPRTCEKCQRSNRAMKGLKHVRTTVNGS